MGNRDGNEETRSKSLNRGLKNTLRYKFYTYDL